MSGLGLKWWVSALGAIALGISAVEAQTPPATSAASIRGVAVNPPQSGRSGFQTLGAEQTGIVFTNRLADLSAGYNQVRMNGSGVALGDVDGDGRCDVYLCGLETPNRLFRNLGDWKFVDVTSAAGVECVGQYSTGAALVDLDGDRDLDLLVNSIERGTRLFLNDGKGHFSEKPQAELNRAAGAMSLAIADVDGDRDLDVYVVNYRTNTIRSTGFSMIVNAKGKVHPEYRGQYEVTATGRLLEYGEPDTLFLNDGSANLTAVAWTDGHFLDEDGKPLTDPPRDWGLSAIFRDLDGNGSPDLYVCNDFWSPDRIWLNDGRGHFRAAPRLMLRHTSNFSMGVDVADIDRDGRDDFLVLDMLSPDYRRRARQRAALGQTPTEPYRIDSRPQIERNTLFWNRGDGTYAEMAQAAGLQASEWSWSAAFLDVDLDGWEDVLITNGHLFDMLDDDIGLRMAASPRRPLAERLLAAPRLNVPNAAFRNHGDRTFEEVATRWGFDKVGVSHGLALADLDNDGDVDVVVNHLNEAAGVYENLSGAPRVSVRVRGRAPNTAGLGARIMVSGFGPPQSQVIASANRYLSSDDAVRVFAAGGVTNLLALQVTWADGTTSRFDSLSANSRYEIVQEALSAPPSLLPREGVAPVAWFTDVSAILNHTHEENRFEEFARQTLLSHRLDTLGPGVSWIDGDGDGWEDLWVAASAGGETGVRRNQRGSTFVPWPEYSSQLRVTADQTMMLGWPGNSNGPHLLDALSGYESGQAESAGVRQSSSKDHSMVMLTNASVVSAGALAMADVNGDGYLDLFVGGRAVPGEYPRAAGCRLLLGTAEGWRLDPTNTLALADVGLITSAVFGDLDLDGDPDLVLATDWGPVQIWLNATGVLTNATRRLQLSQYEGWWTAVATADFDGDGRLDIIAANAGRNTPYQPYLPQGIQAFFGDLSGHGRFEFVEAFTDPARGVLVPWRDRKTLFRAMPWLQERFGSAESFAQASLAEILGAGLARASSVRVTWVESTLFLNRGERFQAVPLPWEAQLAPAFGVCVGDLNGDGAEDVFLAQNFFGMEETVARADAGRGLVLRGDGEGGFVPLSTVESGVGVDGEQRGAALADYDADGRLDLAVAQNSAPTRLFHNQVGPPGLRLRFRGPSENPVGVGVVWQARHGERLGPVHEIQAGTGYLSQDSPVKVVARRQTLTGLRFRWPGKPFLEVTPPVQALEVSIDATGNLRVLR